MRRERAGSPQRVAMLSVHTSPLEQPGTGDAGGMNVYVVETARRLAERGIEVEIFTRATSSSALGDARAGTGRPRPARRAAGPFEGLSKDDLPGQLCAFAAGVMRVEARHDPGWYDLVHSHYWLSGQVGWLAAERWHVPLVHTHAHHGQGQEPRARRGRHARAAGPGDRRGAGGRRRRPARGQHRGRGPRADRPLRRRPGEVVVVPPGVDLELFTPGARRPARRAPPARPAGRRRACCSSSAGSSRSRPRTCCSAPPPSCVAADPDRRAPPDRRRPRRPERHRAWRSPAALQELAAALGVADVVRFAPPVGRAELADWYRAADLVAVPSHSESFGLVAVEAQACGTPVVAARVGGLPTAVADGVTGVLVDGHDPQVWARRSAGPARRPAAPPAPGAAAAVGTRAGSAGTPPSTRCSTSTPRAIADRPLRALGRAGGSRSRRRAGGTRGRAVSEARAARRRVLRRWLEDSELEWEPGARPGEFVVQLPGEAKLRTTVCLLVGDQALSASAFVVRHARREPRGVLPLAARPQQPAARHRLRPGPASATSTSSAGCRCEGVTDRDRRPAARRVLVRADDSFNELLALGFLELDAAGVGLAGLAGRVHPQPRGVPAPARADPACDAAGRSAMTSAYTLVLLRHGESDWNAKNLFTGWVDVAAVRQGPRRGRARRPAARRGRPAARRRAHLACCAGRSPPRTSRSTPPTGTGSRSARPGGSTSGTTARCRARTRSRPSSSSARSSSCSGAAPTTSRRRRWPTTTSSPRPATRATPTWATTLPRTECLKDVVARMLPYWDDAIVPDLRAGRTVLVAAHGNSLRALVKHLDGIGDDDIAGLNIPTGIPLRLRAGRRPAADRPRRAVPRPRGRGRAQPRPSPTRAADRRVGTAVLTPGAAARRSCRARGRPCGACHSPVTR